MRRSQFGRDNTQGKALSDDFRESVVTSLKSSGAIVETGFIHREQPKFPFIRLKLYPIIEYIKCFI